MAILVLSPEALIFNTVFPDFHFPHYGRIHLASGPAPQSSTVFSDILSPIQGNAIVINYIPTSKVPSGHVSKFSLYEQHLAWARSARRNLALYD